MHTRLAQPISFHPLLSHPTVADHLSSMLMQGYGMTVAFSTTDVAANHTSLSRVGFGPHLPDD